MAELSALRARLKDRQVKEGALGTAEMSICLDLGLISELEHLKEEQAQWSLDHRAPSSDDRSLAGPSSGPQNPLDEQVDAKQDEIRAASILVVFRALASSKYEELANQFEDVDGEDRLRWLDALVEACFFEVWSEGQKQDLPWPEIKSELAFGEIDEARTKVFELNRRKQNLPFSLQPSRKRRPLDGTPKPV